MIAMKVEGSDTKHGFTEQLPLFVMSVAPGALRHQTTVCIPMLQMDILLCRGRDEC